MASEEEIAQLKINLGYEDVGRRCGTCRSFRQAGEDHGWCGTASPWIDEFPVAIDGCCRNWCSLEWIKELESRFNADNR